MRIVAAALTIALGLAIASPANAKSPTLYKNCHNLNRKYPHGLGLAHAHDKTTGGAPPVITFFRSDRFYRLAMSYNRGLDRDHDGIACEQA